ncbi:acyl-CoA dehydrogenase [Mycolicibacterium sp. BiH015]|uniref:acyl-CoA dehydrogenase family protein n=1 Tax=Mycolicibacterium sp. BiH015 TaxID=3018808 RepID=UPI0022E2AEC1|nr:acyl-CoA dehydrogenase [Mycolicibacterium sp. BiH015]MDA2894930.1 acyl-CoA dehydrogenase [Mycolicibacterium sp. BiH015]
MSTSVASDAEVELWVSTTKAFLDREAPLTRVRELHELGIPFERDWWRRGAAFGWTALLVPEQLGGGSLSGDGVSELAMIAELFGRSAAPGPLLPVSAVAAALAESSTATAHADTLDALIDGTRVAAWAVDEPGAQFGDAPTTRATTTPEGFRIEGIKDRVEAGSTADVFLVMARADDGCRQFLVPSDSPGVSVRPLAGVDLVRDYAAVEFDGVEVGSHAAVGTSLETAELVARQTMIVQLLQCAEMVGALDTVFDMTVAWAVDRHSFGRPLASYQALKHRFADMKTQFEACRAIVRQATGDVAARAGAAALSVSAAKAYVGEYSVKIIQDCVQLHGGIGVTWEHDLHVLLRRVEVDRALFGSTEEHWERLFALAKAREECQ